ncbi:MAG TPA: endonuclease III domain-containing protein [Deltaproteobacteria bacterium]|nr:endonuclease III domain-containing protein [Deltaproteobacteria bacterium]
MSLNTRQTLRKTSLNDSIPSEIYAILASHYGASGWWPGDSPLEIAVGAILTQNTAWVNVKKAIDNLKSYGMLDVEKLFLADLSELAALIRPSGYYNVKSRRLKNLISVIMDRYAGDLDALLSRDLDQVRTILLGINGIGKETADSICCYAADKLAFVVDAYTARILQRHGLADIRWVYDDIQSMFQQGLPPSIEVYKDLHAYFVFVGKEFCLSKRMLCLECPLRDWMH